MKLSTSLSYTGDPEQVALDHGETREMRPTPKVDGKPEFLLSASGVRRQGGPDG
jgi:hypothetical protein